MFHARVDALSEMSEMREPVLLAGPTTGEGTGSDDY